MVNLVLKFGDSELTDEAIVSDAKINPVVWAATAVSAISFLLNLSGLSAALLSDGLPAQILQTVILLVIGNVVVNIFFLVQFYKAKKACDMQEIGS